jgi:ATP-dependent RNA helicase RhlE
MASPASGGFSDLGLAAPLLRALAEEGYTLPTPIQRETIPPILAGRDLLGCAQTGTGKTAAFALPLLERLRLRPQPKLRGPRILVLVPTRELAIQVAASFATYGRHVAFRHAVIFGGVGQNEQVTALRRGLDVLVATPGRLIDLIAQRHASLGEVETLVLDEADRMLDMGFIDAIRRLLPLLPKVRQNLLFSATMPAPIAALADQILKTPVKVAVAPVATTAENVKQWVLFVAQSHKRALLLDVLADPAMSKVIVFTRTKAGANRVTRELEKAGVTAQAIHGNKSQNARQRALGSFRDGETRVLVATDIAARGIDVDGITHVINFELPNEPESYVHRIGRTARAGARGIALAFCDDAERDYLRDIERLTRVKLNVVADHPYAGVAPRPAPASPPRRGPGHGSEHAHRAGAGAGGGRPNRRRRPHGR